MTRAVLRRFLRGAVVEAETDGIPEVVGDPSLVLPIPQRFTPASRAIPSPKETENWLAAIAAFWDDPGRVERLGSKLRERVQQYAKEAVAKELEKLLDKNF